MIKKLVVVSSKMSPQETMDHFSGLIDKTELEPLIGNIFGSVKANNVNFDIILKSNVDDIPLDTHTIIKNICGKIGLDNVKIEIESDKQIAIHVKAKQ